MAPISDGPYVKWMAPISDRFLMAPISAAVAESEAAGLSVEERSRCIG